MSILVEFLRRNLENFDPNFRRVDVTLVAPYRRDCSNKIYWKKVQYVSYERRKKKI
jgi:hypothetical protein